MAVTNFIQKFYKELSVAPVDWALGNIGDKIRIETTFTVETFAISSTKNPFIVNAKDGYLGSGWVVDRRGQFRDFKIGDTVIYFDRFDNRHDIKTIVDKKSDNEVQFDSAFSGFTDDDPEPNFVFSITVPITAVSYNWNFIENSDPVNYQSMVDGSTQTLISKAISASSAVPVDMIFLGKKDYQIGSATIEGISIDDGTTDGVYKSNFKIVHYTYITPFMLAAEVVGIGVATKTPVYFVDTKCLRFVSHIDAFYEYTDPNRLQSADSPNELGNTGGWNENFNTGITNYSCDAPVYKDIAGTVISGISLSGNTTCKIVINNTTDSPFTGATKFVLNIIKASISETEYKGIGNTMEENFLFDRAAQTIGSGAVNGDRYGTSRQIITSLTGTIIDSGKIEIDFTAALGVDVLVNLNSSESPSYRMWVSVQNHSLATDISDLVNVRIEDYRSFFIETSDPDMIVISPTVILRHPETDPTTQGITPAPVTAGFNPFLGWNVLASTGTPTLILRDQASGKVIGCADFNVTIEETLALLSDSVNDNVNYGTLPGTLVFDNSAGYTAQWLSDFPLLFGLFAPAGSFASINGTVIQLGYSGGTFSVESNHNGQPDWAASSSISFINGTDPGGATVDVFPEDEIVAYSKFYIDLNGRSTDAIKLLSATTRVKAKNSDTGEYFILDEFDLNLSSYPFIGPVQNIDFSVDRIFHIPENTIRKQILVKRRPDIDGGNRYYFEAWHPFLMRWEYWTSLVGANAAFFNATQPQQGLNEFWYRYSQVGNWGIYHEIIITAVKNGAQQVYSREAQLTPHDWNDNADYAPYDNTGSNIKAYDNDSNAELIDPISGKKFIQGWKNTRVEANFKRVSEIPDLSKCTCNMRIEVYEQGGIAGSRRMSSKWPSDSDTWYLSTVGDFKTQLSLVGHTLTAKALVDFSKLPNSTKFKISARLYQIDGAAIGKLTEEGEMKLTEDGTFKIID